MSSSSSLYRVDVRHIAHLWKVLGQSFFGSNKYTLTTLAGRRKAIAHLCQRSPRTIQNITTNWDLITGPPSGTAVESSTVPEDHVNETLDPVVEAEEMEGVAGVGRHLLRSRNTGKFVRSFTGSTRVRYTSRWNLYCHWWRRKSVLRCRNPRCIMCYVEWASDIGMGPLNTCLAPSLKVRRIRYIRAVRQFRQKNALIACLDETWLNENYQFRKRQSHPSGSGKRLVIFDVVTDRGFVPGCGLIWEASKHTEGCHGNFNYQNYEKFMKEVVVPRLKEFARLHGYDTFRRPKRVKKEIQQWLTDHRIEFDAQELVAELWHRVTDFLKNHVGDRYYMDDYLKTEEGTETVRLPPYHSDFNPIEKCWARRKRRLPQALAYCIKLEDDYWDIDTKEDRIEAVGDEQADEDVAEEGGDLEPLDQDLDDDNDLALLPF
ncbi:hypothetical protein RvY_06926 [Ramazzottius varieornatus]|uniref:Tc1-like transposase DDE domain-containing protein n=1 Tax=Ramazzottius varieornatus TaxID=947166 RepID=A0A1D1V325_RAMVA|nr:hypothetical protein RvY_06926 [Ramazzottius varieornatus]